MIKCPVCKEEIEKTELCPMCGSAIDKYKGIKLTFSIISFFLGMSVIGVQSIFPSLFFVVLSIVLFPFFWNKIKTWSRCKNSLLFGVLISFVSCNHCAIRSVIEANAEKEQKRKEAMKADIDRRFKIQEFNENKQHIIAEAERLIEKKDYEGASVIVGPFTNIVQDDDFNRVCTTLQQKKEIEQNLKKMDQMVKYFNSIPESNYEEKYNVCNQIVEIFPDNVEYKTKRQYYEKLVESKKREEQVSLIVEKEKAEKKAKIESQFSSWNGAHKKVEALIKDSMHNPDSYKHVETRYKDMGTYLLIFTAFRGTNAFGGIIKNEMVVKVDYDGEVIEIVYAPGME